MPYQSQSNAYVAYKQQSAKGTQATGSGATILHTAGGQGGRLSKAAIESNTVRRDGMRIRGRHGTQKTQGAYNHELGIGSLDDILEAVMRGTYEADLVITQATASLTSITTTASAIIAGGGSWITAGLRVGDVVRLTNHSTAENNNRNLIIRTVTATILEFSTTTGSPLTVNAVADTSFTITRPGRKLINPAAGSLVSRYFTIEEYEVDIDGSEIFWDAVWGSVQFQMQPNGLFMANPTFVGTGRMDASEDSLVPHFTSPTEPTLVPFATIDSTVILDGTSVVDLTAFDLTIDITPNSPDVVASKYGPDVFSGQMAVSMNLTMLRDDLADVISFLEEEVLSLHVVAVDNEDEPEDFFSIFVPNFTLGSVDKSALSKEGGARTQTISIPPALVGKDETGGAFDATMIKIQLSNAS